MQFVDIIKLRLDFWYQCKWPSLAASFNDFFLNPSAVVTVDKSRILVSLSWPPIGSMKLNVDGSASGKPGSATVGGVL